MSEEPQPEVTARDLWGVRATVLFVALIGLEFLVFALMGVSLIMARDREYRGTGVLIFFCSCALVYGNWKTITGLFHGHRYAAYSASVHGLLILLFCGLVTFDLYHPERASVDEGFGILMMPLIAPVGLWLLVYPHLPHVRRCFQRTLPQA